MSRSSRVKAAVERDIKAVIDKMAVHVKGEVGLAALFTLGASALKRLEEMARVHHPEIDTTRLMATEESLLILSSSLLDSACETRNKDNGQQRPD